MAEHFREPERRQKALLPADMMEWLPQDDIVHPAISIQGAEFQVPDRPGVGADLLPEKLNRYRQ